MADAIDYRPGVVLWFRHVARGGNEVTVKTVGRRWVSLTNGMRVEIGSRQVDGGDYSSPGMLWRSRQEYEEAMALLAQWIAFQQRLTHQVPEGLTVEKLEAVRELLGMSG